MFGVFDSVGPQVFFAESRERAEAEVARANEIVARFPNTISMRHLREMDAAWRAARGLPPLPEPEGRRIVVPAPVSGPTRVAEVPGGGGEVGADAGGPGAPPTDAHSPGTPAPEAPEAPEPSSSVSAVLDTAAQVAARETMRLRVESAEADLERTSQLADELSRAAAAADPPLVRFRAALRKLYGEHAHAAEDGFRRLVLEQGAERAVTTIREDPRALLPDPRPRELAGGTAARTLAAEQGVLCAPLLERLDRCLIAACDHAGVARPRDYADAAEHRRMVLDHLRELAPTQRAVLEEARADYRRAAGLLADPDRLRREWAGLTEPQRDAVRAAVPNLDRLLASPPAAVLRRAGPGPSL
ncbi:MAG TPA: hypothetical protein VF746_14645 [Longimicrobium sp.]